MFQHGEFHRRLSLKYSQEEPYLESPGVLFFYLFIFLEWNQPICLQLACVFLQCLHTFVSSLAPAAHTLPSGFQSPADSLNSSVTCLFGLFLVPDSTGYQLHKVYSRERGTFCPAATSCNPRSRQWYDHFCVVLGNFCSASNQNYSRKTVLLRVCL